VLFLGKTLEKNQWFALMLLMLGVGSVQLSQTSSSGAQITSPSMRAMGMVILLLAALCSSLAAVSFEKLLKGVKVDLWTRNLQLAMFSIICSIVPLLVTQDGERLRHFGFFHGYTWLTWSCIAMNAFGGLLVGAVINYCDAILKDVAIGASIVVSAMGSMYFFDFQPQGGFTLGVVAVSYAVPLYAGRAGMCNVKEFLSTVFWNKMDDLANTAKQLQLISVDEKDAFVDLEMMKPNLSKSLMR
jgi:UDP-sugar transporter A1/2/3